MKRVIIFVFSLALSLTLFAQKKVDKMDENKWNWIEYTGKIGSVTFEDGYMVLESKTLPKGNPFNAVEYTKAVNASMIKTFAQLPLRGRDNYKITVKYIDPNFGKGIYQIYFNANKGCVEDDNCSHFFLQVAMGGQYTLTSFDGNLHMDKLPFKGKKDFPMEFVLTKKGNEATIELNGVQLYSGICPLTESGLGFCVLWKKKLKIDEVIIEQLERADED